MLCSTSTVNVGGSGNTATASGGRLLLSAAAGLHRTLSTTRAQLSTRVILLKSSDLPRSPG